MKERCLYPTCVKEAINGKFCSKEHSPYGQMFLNKRSGIRRARNKEKEIDIKGMPFEDQLRRARHRLSVIADDLDLLFEKSPPDLKALYQMRRSGKKIYERVCIELAIRKAPPADESDCP